MNLYPSLQNRLLDQHHAIRELIGKMDEVVLRKKPVPKKWSVYENLAHLVRYQQIFLERLNLILTTNTPSFDRYKAEDDPDFGNFLSHTMEELLTKLENDRKKIIAQIQGLSQEELLKTGTHPKLGVMTVVEWTEFFILHEAHHLYVIFHWRK
ncbi:hypothetical protein C900_03892 [Fulvivirga imtechensis AK7]|uniref:DinB-like domain-containing protein n=1 Tax=Fulvivirga imtechensis AK7 TaxID=1237149 RepID=L8JS61_9BACT|nr:DinB family protein [Fulvivirga imtechensis]ELR70207.1 hypothetical protein C900_03892 [Fulvivirga imtechensis AK7]